MSQSQGVCAVHSEVPGRIRVRVDGLRHSPAVKQALEQSLPGERGIRGVSASVRTGTVLVHFAPDIAPDRIVDRVAQVRCEVRRAADPGTAPPNGRDTASPPAGSGGNTGRAVAPLAGERPSASVIPVAFGQPALAVADRAMPPCHAWEGEAVLRHFGSSLQLGLTQAAAEERLRRFGANDLPPQPRPSALAMIMQQVASWPVGLLAGSAVISLATGGVIDAIAIGCVVAINTAIGYATESQTERTIRSLAGPASRTVHVRRDGEIRAIDSGAVVPGDILALTPGSFVAADARIVLTNGLTVDESALTGESMPVMKSPAVLAGAAIPLADRTNMVYRGTVVTGGHGFAVVSATGSATEISQIQLLAGEVRAPETPMQRQLGVLGRQLAVLSGLSCLAAFGFGLLRGYGWVQMLKSSTALAVAAVPEGLPAMATTTLALGIRSMRRHKVLVRRLDAVETLGSVQVLCLDKTGTLTQNRMSVVAIHAGMAPLRVEDDRIAADWDSLTPGTQAMLQRLLEVVVLCNEAELADHPGGDGSSWNGSPTEAALVRLAQSSGLDVAALREARPRTEVTYRGENRNFMTTLHALGDGRTLVAVKGSPEEVLALCRRCERDSRASTLTEADREAILAANRAMAARSLRVLGVAYAETRGPAAPEEGELTWLGLVGMADPVRPGMAELIECFHTAGIQTIMITGDQSATASAIGRQLDLGGGDPVVIIESSNLENCPPDQLSDLAVRAHVFARVSPAHKLQIVQALQRGGKVVAMTGDGINDGPALKAADVGVAMGREGTDIARDVGDIILEDDDLHSMELAIARGRTIYGNSRKAIKFLLATNLSEIMLVLGSIGAGLGQPLTPMQLLWINLISDIFPALALAQEPPEPDVLRQPPRDPATPIIGGRDLGQLARESAVLCSGPLAAYLLAQQRYGAGPRAGTIAFNSLVLAQLLHAVTSRSERHGVWDRQGMPTNRYLQTALLGSLVGQGLVAFLPWARGLLGSTPMGLFDVLLAAAAGLVPFAVNELFRARPSEPPRELPGRRVVERLLQGEPVEGLSRELGVEVYRLEAWRARAMAADTATPTACGGGPGQAEAGDAEDAGAAPKRGAGSAE